MDDGIDLLAFEVEVVLGQAIENYIRFMVNRHGFSHRVEKVRVEAVVRVQEEAVVSCCLGKAPVAGPGHAAIFGQVDDMYSRVPGRRLIRNGPAVVRGGIVYNQKLKFSIGLAQNVPYGIGQIGFHPVGREDDRKHYSVFIRKAHAISGGKSGCPAHC